MTIEAVAIVPVTTDMVIEAIEALSCEDWTTSQLADAMQVPEYPVRAAVSWLLVRKVLEVSGTRKGYYWTGRKRKTYQSNTYRLKGQGKVDFNTLNMAFVYGR